MYTGEPQVGQNARVFMLPLSPLRLHSVAAPVCFTSAPAKLRYEPWPVPLLRWQSRHWQSFWNTGSPEIS
ncbi:hypothetical protein D3C72_2354540 [compost metagenome]